MTGQEHLHSALEVELFLASQQVPGQVGSLWRRAARPAGKKPAAPAHSFYHGSAGVLVFYLELHQATGDQRYLDQAVSAGEELLAWLPQQQFLTVGFYSGWPGHVFALNELFRACGDQRFRAGAQLALQRLMDQSEPLGQGIGWIEAIPFSDITGITGEREVLDLSVGSAGAGVILLYAHRQGLDDRALGWARQTADRLLEMAEQTPDGPRWLMMADMPFPFTAPNFAHGGAGVAYFLADLYRDTGKAVYLDTAIAAARYVQSRSVPVGDGHLVCHNEEQQPPTLFYLGVCHGPAGTGRLMVLLHDITGDDSWLAWLDDNLRGLLATGAPEVRSDGLWQNYSQCCGDAGIGDYALGLYQRTGRADCLDLAQRIAAHLIASSEVTAAGRSWQQAEHRPRPEFLETQTGYMQGAAGLGSFLLHLATVSEPTMAQVVLPESPFGPGAQQHPATGAA